MSFIYDRILERMGWFDAGPWEPLSMDVSYEKYLTDHRIDNSTRIGYFPGCFAEWHEGHQGIVWDWAHQHKARYHNDNYMVVISPANSDYTVQKYGANSIHATNKYRYDKIIESLKGCGLNVMLDLNPMLNHDRDKNFTDLALDFVTRLGLDWFGLIHTPTILCGKDRKNFARLEKVTSLVDVFYGEDITSKSSSALIRESDDNHLVKKKLILRCNNHRELEIFRQHLGDYYSDVVPAYISDEKYVIQSRNQGDYDVTICKDYADILEYVPVHRSYTNPLEENGHVCDTDYDFSGKSVLDSDTFSGGTAEFLMKKGAATVHTFHDLREKVDEWELLDFSDFADFKYVYPYVDVSSRCSLPAFDRTLHKKYGEFLLSAHVTKSILKQKEDLEQWN